MVHVHVDDRQFGTNALASHVGMEKMWAGTHAASNCTIPGWVTVAAAAVVVRSA